jgi:hypothetical protein
MRYLSLLYILTFQIRCYIAEIDKNYSLKDKRLCYFILIAAIEENDMSQAYDVASGVEIFKASVTKSGH